MYAARKYIVTPITGLAVAGMVGGVSAMSAAGGVYRVGLLDEATGEVPWWGDFRFLGAAAALGLNLLPMVGGVPIVGPFIDGALGWLQSQPLVGGPVSMLLGDTAQDYAALLGGAALISYAATEGVGVKETGQFMGLPMPDFVMEFLDAGAMAPALDTGPIPAIQEVLGEV